MILIHKVLPNFGRVGEKCKLEQLMLVPLYSLISSNEIKDVAVMDMQGCINSSKLVCCQHHACQ